MHTIQYEAQVNVTVKTLEHGSRSFISWRDLKNGSAFGWDAFHSINVTFIIAHMWVMLKSKQLDVD